MYLPIFTLFAFFTLLDAVPAPPHGESLDFQNELSRLEQKLWGIEVRLMHVERLQFNNHPLGMTPGGIPGMPLRSPGALVRRNETIRRRGGLSDSGRASDTAEADRESYFPPV